MIDPEWSRRTLEFNCHFGDGFGECLAGTQEEWNATPARRIDIETECRVGLGIRIGLHARHIEVPVVLTAHEMFRLDNATSFKDFALLVAQRFGMLVDGLLHRQ